MANDGGDKMTSNRIRRAIQVSIALLATCVLATQAEAEDPKMIRFTTDTTQTSLPIWWAEENGMFGKEGLQYSDTLVNAGFLGLQSIGAGRNDASIQSDPPTCTNIAKGVDAVIVAVVAKGQKSMGLVARDPYKTVEDLKGKKVIWMQGTGGELGFIKYLEARGMSPTDFEHINLAPAEAVPTLVNGGADAMWFWEPWPRRAAQIAPDNLDIIARSSRDEYDLNMILTVRREFAEQDPDAVKKFLKVLIEAEEELNADPEAAAALYARRLRTTIEEARVALGDYPIHLTLDGQFVKELKDVCALKAKLANEPETVDITNAIDPSFLRDVAPERVKDF
jgi:ABC-type nitrate/sulfonate/bicarbonate transport system substrate-binding protein